jgi:TM2 domain-containing membrane protein YozV
MASCRAQPASHADVIAPLVSPQNLFEIPKMNDSTRSMMMYDAQKKSGVVAFLLWLFLGSLGAHRFYLGFTGTAVLQLLLFIFGWTTAFAYVGLFLLLALYVWLFIDVFCIAAGVREHNTMLAQRLSE